MKLPVFQRGEVERLAVTFVLTLWSAAVGFGVCDYMHAAGEQRIPGENAIVLVGTPAGGVVFSVTAMVVGAFIFAIIIIKNNNKETTP